MMTYSYVCMCCGEEVPREELRASPFRAGQPWCRKCLAEWDAEMANRDYIEEAESGERYRDRIAYLREGGFL